MIIKQFSPELHYEEICRWWESHGWPVLPLDHLPIGYVVESKGRPVCAGFVYYTGTAFCLFEFIVARKDCGLKERAAALDVLISSVKLFAKQAGVKSIFMSMKHDGLIAKLCDKHGFVKSDEAMTNLIGRL